ncbi:TonB-dependent receptor domain-containing protein [Pleomorphovibrio marinus]|uniref:TonB-dependent receptor domain-containing protein n=1 Tax=Pleomorphovibrio marinus TaxID=2164132 RepID=UPI000E0B2577|nr:TonB-dependent receptor [Pleomorphovibrio marinus]
MRISLLLFLLISAQFSFAQSESVELSGQITDKDSGSPLPFVNIILNERNKDSFIGGTVSNENGQFNLKLIPPGNYFVELSFTGYKPQSISIQVGRLSEFLDLGRFEMEENTESLDEVVVSGRRSEVSELMDKKTFNIEDNISQLGGSVLQAMQNLPGITIDQEGKVQLRGSDRVVVLIDGQQTALTGFGNQAGLDNIPASAIERIEVINNPSARYDAQGMAGIINIIMKKNKESGFNGRAGLVAGLGALGEQRANFPDLPDQYLWNPSINPSLSLNYRKEKVNFFLQGDLMSFRRLNKNEFIRRTYDDGEIIDQQFLENRTQTAYTINTGADLYLNNRNTVTISALFGRESHIDRGSLPYFNAISGERQRLWRYWEDEVNTTINISTNWEHTYEQPGRKLQIGLSYAFQREDELFYFDNILPNLVGTDSTFLIADENVLDFELDYIRPLRAGRVELGSKVRWRYIPTNMQFVPGENSILDPGAAGWANYDERIGAVYSNYVYEQKNWEVEAGLRVEYAILDYEVIPGHNTYESDGYTYFQPFPNMRFAYILNENNKLSLFFNRRVDRPEEEDLRIFPKYDDPEILKTGNPSLRPQFTQSLELGYRSSWKTGYLYTAFYGRRTQDIITRVITQNPTDNLLNAISQNTGTGTNIGVEMVWEQDINEWYNFNLNGNVYHNTISAFTIENLYPFNTFFTMEEQRAYSGNVKWNNNFSLPNDFKIQLTGIYLAPDLLPQGRIDTRFSVDFGLTKSLQNGKGELFVNGSDIFNTLRIKREIRGDGFDLVSTDFFQTQVFRVGYNYRF